MKFRVKYMHRISAATYYHTIFADDINEASRQAEKRVRKDYQVISVVQDV